MKLPPTSRSPLVSLIYSDLLQFSQVIKATCCCWFIFSCMGTSTFCRAPRQGKPATPSPVVLSFAPPAPMATFLPISSPRQPRPDAVSIPGGGPCPPAAGQGAGAWRWGGMEGLVPKCCRGLMHFGTDPLCFRPSQWGQALLGALAEAGGCFEPLRGGGGRATGSSLLFLGLLLRPRL